MSMKQTMWRLPAVLLLVVMVVGPAITAQSGLFYPDPKIDVFEPVVHPKEPGPVDLVFRFAPPESYKGDGTFEVRIVKDVSAFYSGPTEWTITALPDQPHEETLTMTVLPDTVVGMILNILGENYIHLAGAYFVHRNDSVEFWKGYPGPLPAPDDMRAQPDDKRNVRLYLRTENQRDEVLAIVDSLPDSSIAKPINTRITVRQLHEVSRLGVKLIDLDSPLWKQDSSQFLRDLWWLHKYRGGGRKDTTDRDDMKPSDPSGALDDSVCYRVDR